MIAAMNKLFGLDVSSIHLPRMQVFEVTWPFRRRNSACSIATPRTSIDQIKMTMEASIQELRGIAAVRLRRDIRCASSVRELWLLRGDTYSLISMQVNQQAAAVAINALLPCFTGWMPEHQLLEI